MSEKDILFINGKQKASDRPYIDTLTKKVAGALDLGLPAKVRRKSYRCACGVQTDRPEVVLPGGVKVHPLAVHFLAWHRSSIPSSQRRKVRDLQVVPMSPTVEQLAYPR
jgi:hypothetical protein